MVGSGWSQSHAKTPSSATVLLLDDRPDDSRPSRSRPDDSASNPRLLRLLLLIDRCSPPSTASPPLFSLSPLSLLLRCCRSDDSRPSLVLLFDRLTDPEDLYRDDDDRTLEELRRERLALIFRCIIARRLRRLVNSMPRNMNRLPIRQSMPRVYFALLATLKLAREWDAELMPFIRLPKLLIRELLVQMGLSSAEHDLLAAMRAPAVE